MNCKLFVLTKWQIKEDPSKNNHPFWSQNDSWYTSNVTLVAGCCGRRVSTTIQVQYCNFLSEYELATFHIAIPMLIQTVRCHNTWLLIIKVTSCHNTQLLIIMSLDAITQGYYHKDHLMPYNMDIYHTDHLIPYNMVTYHKCHMML